MKRMLIIPLILIMAVSIFGCKKAAEDSLQASDAVMTPSTTETPFEEEPTPEKENPTEGQPTENDPTEENIPSESIPVHKEPEQEQPLEDIWGGREDLKQLYKNRMVTSRFNYEDIMDMKKISRDEFSYVSFYNTGKEHTYTYFKKALGSEGAIVIGRAFGERASYHDTVIQGHTETKFKVEKVLAGAVEDEVISLFEHYFLFDGKGNPNVKEPCVVFEDTYMPSFLENDRLMLLFIRKSDINDDFYTQFYYSFPLSEDYEYTEERFAELLNFYRGEEGAYNKEITWRWDKSSLSDEALLAQLNENVLLQMAAEYKVIVWPKGHKNYEPPQSLFLSGGFQIASYPD